MAKFKLLAPHNFRTSKGPAYFEAGTEIDSAEVLDFQCTPHMAALDSEAEALLKAECDRLRATGTSLEYGCVPGVGPVQTLPA